MKTLSLEDVAALEEDGGEIVREPELEQFPPAGMEAAHELEPPPVAQDPESMAAMAATLDAYREEGLAMQEATQRLIAQSAEAIKMLAAEMGKTPRRGPVDFEIIRDDSVKGDYKPIKRVLVRPAGV